MDVKGESIQLHFDVDLFEAVKENPLEVAPAFIFRLLFVADSNAVGRGVFYHKPPFVVESDTKVLVADVVSPSFWGEEHVSLWRLIRLGGSKLRHQGCQCMKD